GDLLELYAQSIVLARGAFAEIELTGGVTADGKKSPWTAILEKKHPAPAAFAARLRLFPPSPPSPPALGRQKPPPVKKTLGRLLSYEHRRRPAGSKADIEACPRVMSALPPIADID